MGGGTTPAEYFYQMSVAPAYCFPQEISMNAVRTWHLSGLQVLCTAQIHYRTAEKHRFGLGTGMLQRIFLFYSLAGLAYFIVETASNFCLISMFVEHAY